MQAQSGPSSWYIEGQVPRRWQENAFALWKEAQRGVIEVVTGGGKTFFALQCILHIRTNSPSYRFLIVVPTVALLDQWHATLTSVLHVSESDISLLGGGFRPSPDRPIVLAVLNSARRWVS